MDARPGLCASGALVGRSRGAGGSTEEWRRLRGPAAGAEQKCGGWKWGGRMIWQRDRPLRNHHSRKEAA